MRKANLLQQQKSIAYCQMSSPPLVYLSICYVYLSVCKKTKNDKNTMLGMGVLSAPALKTAKNSQRKTANDPANENTVVSIGLYTHND